MQFELIGMDDEGWRHALECVAATIYHQPSYLRTAEQFEEGQLRIAFLREGNQFLGVPLLLRQVPQEISDSACWLDAKSPYGYVSPISSTNDRDQLKCFWEALANNLQAQGIISIFCRSHPLLRSVYQTNALPECGRVVSHGRTVWIDLELPDEEIWRQTNHGHRRNINSLRRQGFECQFDQWQHYDDFIKIYWDTMSRVDASAFYFFSKEYFYALRNNLEDDVHLATVISPDGQIAAAGIFFEKEGLCDYHLSGTSRDFLKLAPMKLLLHQATTWAKSRGLTALHLGGGNGAREDSLFGFKAGFSKLRADFATYQLICNANAYGELERRWRRRFSVCDEYSENFFPIYRAPCPTV